VRGVQHFTGEARAVAGVLFPLAFTAGAQGSRDLRNLSSKALLIPTVMFLCANALTLMTLPKLFQQHGDQASRTTQGGSWHDTSKGPADVESFTSRQDVHSVGNFTWVLESCSMT